MLLIGIFHRCRGDASPPKTWVSGDVRPTQGDSARMGGTRGEMLRQSAPDTGWALTGAANRATEQFDSDRNAASASCPSSEHHVRHASDSDFRSTHLF